VLSIVVAGVAGADGHAWTSQLGRPVSLSIVPGGESVAVGDRLRLALIARYSGGLVRNLGSSAAWSSSAPSIVRVNGKGQVRAYENGRATIEARIPGARAATFVRVGARSLGPLRIGRANPRYFIDRSGRPVYLAGAHTWGDLQDNGVGDPPPRFDYTKFLEFLQVHTLRVFRLWAWEQARDTGEIKGQYHFFPSVYRRTGPAAASDGKPRFDLRRFDPAYFDRLRRRVIAARERGIYVIVMLFNGWSVERKGNGDNPWDGHPFNGKNNVNGIDGDLDGDGSGAGGLRSACHPGGR
jgi:hypothetical protein